MVSLYSQAPYRPHQRSSSGKLLELGIWCFSGRLALGAWCLPTGCACCVAFVLLLVSTLSVQAGNVDGAPPLEWSIRLANAEMNRLQNQPAKWDYTMGLFTLALLKLDQKAPNPAYVEFARYAVGSLVSLEGQIKGYKPEEYQLDALNPGKTLVALWQLKHEARYRQAAELLYHQLDHQPRTPDGGFWHKQRYTNQMWLDGLYMAGPFQAQAAALFGPPAAFDDVARQAHLIDLHTYDPATGLNYHGWDAAKVQPWADPQTGNSSNFWGRAMGWYAMALVDELD
jgi:unsaturated rhamnogalacturonyl hydrolase